MTATRTRPTIKDIIAIGTCTPGVRGAVARPVVTTLAQKYDIAEPVSEKDQNVAQRAVTIEDRRAGAKQDTLTVQEVSKRVESVDKKKVFAIFFVFAGANIILFNNKKSFEKRKLWYP